MNNSLKAYVAAFLYAVIIGFSFLAIKIGLLHASSTDILAHRFLVAGLTAVLMLLLKRKRPHLSPRDVLSILGLALFYPFLFFLLQTLSLVYIETVEAGIIQALSPVITLMLAFILIRERITLRKCLSILISVGGVIFIFIMGGASLYAYSPVGLALIFGATTAISCYLVFARKLTKRYSTFALTTVMSLAGCFAFGAISLTLHLSEDTLSHFFDPFASLEYVLAIVFLGIASSYLSAFLSNYALASLQAAKMSVFGNLATVVSLAAGALILHEDFFWFHAVGSAAVIIGIFIMNLPAGKRHLVRENHVPEDDE